jgi:SAM-dependent methyltransferase
MLNIFKKIYKRLFNEKSRIRHHVLFDKITSIAYRGKTYTCNCCNRSFRKLKAKGIFYKRENAKCPYCGSLERTRVLLFYVRNETELLTEKRSLLHFAPEAALYSTLKNAPALNYIAADINPNYADHVVDIMHINFPDNAFDYIICSHVLAHVPDERKAVREMYRVLKPGGTALIMTLIDRDNPKTTVIGAILDAEKRKEYCAEPDLFRLHGSDFGESLAREGFRVEEIDYTSKLGAEISRTHCLGNKDRELIFRCIKPNN